ncbi:conserved hypothetical protein [Pediculus humanus corporis]|uniref:Uncharacterized protein n=1 Tax=Pediculus humanus subsp. corporis TaxID=121224 RepID=E0VGT0_PEDHC|nr:uncharacterized protein Phum_PHUM192050 [Pediculus humanus corporis]EEB12586.1 conserved hypothetical protein [Pediculus humanus corporis]
MAVVSAKPVFTAAAAYTNLPLTAPVAYATPGLVTATSSQYFARNYNGLYSLPYVATAAAAAPAPLITSSAYSYAPAFLFCSAKFVN